jgi:hypothetical protein
VGAVKSTENRLRVSSSGPSTLDVAAVAGRVEKRMPGAPGAGKCAVGNGEAPPRLWDVLGWDLDDRLTVEELLGALGPRGLELLAGEAGDPIPLHAWNGSEDAFDAVDENDDGYVEPRGHRPGGCRRTSGWC